MRYTNRLIDAIKTIKMSDVQMIANEIRLSMERGSTVWLFGNGGSFANAQHWACDLQKAASVCCCLLGSNLSLLTAYSNDVDYSLAVREEFRRVVRPKDLLVALSCSGTSPNVVAVLLEAKNLHTSPILLTGSIEDDRYLRDSNVTVVRVNSKEYDIIEDCHMAIGHYVTREIIRG